LAKPKEKAINKIGHALHELSPEFRKATLSARNAAIAQSIGFRQPLVLQSMVICKQPEIGGRVPPHQDSTFLFTDPPSAVGFWYALEDATIENGCLGFLPGSHKTSAIKSRFVRAQSGGTTFEELDRGRYARDMEPSLEEVANGPSLEQEYTIGEVKAGTLVLIHGNLLHKSERNLSQKSRFIYTFHMIEGDCTFDHKNWLQPSEAGFTDLNKEILVDG
jgi:phytanoyl-CoA hydroxylase